MLQGGVVTLEDAATVLLDEHDERNVKYKSKMRFCRGWIYIFKLIEEAVKRV